VEISCCVVEIWLCLVDGMSIDLVEKSILSIFVGGVYVVVQEKM